MKNQGITQTDETIYAGIRGILVAARTKVAAVINTAMVEAYWHIGQQITETLGERAEYGKKLLQYLSGRLTAEFGKGFSVRNLQQMRNFYEKFPIAQTPSAQLRDNTAPLHAELSWSHYCLLIKITEPERRQFYEKECAESNWSVRQLERQINVSGHRAD